jgi:hypothetical protein
VKAENVRDSDSTLNFDGSSAGVAGFAATGAAQSLGIFT